MCIFFLVSTLFSLLLLLFSPSLLFLSSFPSLCFSFYFFAFILAYFNSVKILLSPASCPPFHSSFPFFSFLFPFSFGKEKRSQLMKDKPREEKRGEKGRWAKNRRKEKVK
jgi:hypothetical protein